jgi:DNA-binding NtrC family response regulator
MSFYSTCREFCHHLLGWPEEATHAPVVQKHELLAVSPDTRFFSSLAQLATLYDWEVHWARSVPGAVDILASGSTPVVIYDCCSAHDDWSASIARLMRLPDAPCIVLAVPDVDEDLWRRAINQQVYDVVCRDGNRQHLLVTLDFARKWKTARGHRAGESGGIAGNRELRVTRQAIHPPAPLSPNTGR